MGGFMRKKSTKATKQTAKKIDGRTKEGKAAIARKLDYQKRAAKARLTKAENKRKSPHETYNSGFKREKAEVSKAEVYNKPGVFIGEVKGQAYTQQEFDEAKQYFDNARSEVSSTVRSGLGGIPKAEWDTYTHINVNGGMKKLKTVAVAAVLGVNNG
jgi:hypothetical protein